MRHKRTTFYFNNGQTMIAIEAADHWEAERLFAQAMAARQKPKQKHRPKQEQQLSPTDYATIHGY